MVSVVSGSFKICLKVSDSSAYSEGKSYMSTNEILGLCVFCVVLAELEPT